MVSPSFPPSLPPFSFIARSITFLQYPRGDDPAALSKLMDNNSLVKFESWLAMKGTTFLLADSPTCPDFHLWELLDQLVEAAAVDGVAKGPLDGRPHHQAPLHALQNSKVLTGSH